MNCKICNKTFKSNKYLQQHLKCKRHTEQTTKQSNYQCELCGKKYSIRQSLHAHKKLCNTVVTPATTVGNPTTKTIQEVTYTQKQMEEVTQAFRKELDKVKKEINKINNRLEKMDVKTQEKRRKKINKGVRQKIVDQQENTCGECEVILSPYFELDHIIGLQFGGTDDESNLMALCRECHAKKSITENQCRKQIQDAIQTILKNSVSVPSVQPCS